MMCGGLFIYSRGVAFISHFLFFATTRCNHNVAMVFSLCHCGLHWGGGVFSHLCWYCLLLSRVVLFVCLSLFLFLSFSFFTPPCSLSPFFFFSLVCCSLLIYFCLDWQVAANPRGYQSISGCVPIGQPPTRHTCSHIPSLVPSQTRTHNNDNNTHFNKHTDRDRNNHKKNNEWKDALDPPNPFYPLIHSISRFVSFPCPCSYFRPFVTLTTGPSSRTYLIATTVSHLTPLTSISTLVFFFAQ